MNNLEVYLAGPISGESWEEAVAWRVGAQERLWEAGINAYSPLRNKQYLANETAIADRYDQHVMSTAKAITTRDRWDVYRSDVVLVNLEDAKKVSIGTVMEIGWADAYRKIIVTVLPKDSIHRHAMIEECSSYIVETLEDAIETIIRLK